MSGDVTAAIEYLSAFAEHDEDTVRREDVRIVLAEVERLRAERQALLAIDMDENDEWDAVERILPAIRRVLGSEADQ